MRSPEATFPETVSATDGLAAGALPGWRWSISTGPAAALAMGARPSISRFWRSTSRSSGGQRGSTAWPSSRRRPPSVSLDTRSNSPITATFFTAWKSRSATAVPGAAMACWLDQDWISPASSTAGCSRSTSIEYANMRGAMRSER